MSNVNVNVTHTCVFSNYKKKAFMFDSLSGKKSRENP